MGSKRKALEMITNIFCKKSKENETLETKCESNDRIDNNMNPNQSLQTLTAIESDNKSCFSETYPKSPISPRVKNFDSDMETLMLSRHDNPYIIQQIERLSTKDMLSISGDPSPVRSIQKISLNNLESNSITDNNFMMDSETAEAFEDNLHDKLIRSPPPQFPNNLSHFLFPGVSASSIHTNSDYSPSRQYLSPNSRANNRLQMNSSNKSQNNLLSIVSTSQKDSQHLEINPNHCNKYERRGSDSSLLPNNWKTTFYTQSMAVSSSSLLTFPSRCPPFKSSANHLSNDSNMSYSECQTSQSNDINNDMAIDEMDIYQDLDENSKNHCNDCWTLISSSDSREALLQDIKQIN
ncbi:uncharacterized protein LOC128965888 [Oppia nitens]|uniref:uncharacterized protein LOC128965888 n=1 Tax=Oppia nitens TaxID=1686743 RepID=UPI0023DA5265|nr:uncharacterized protein LOC128965888 [Oppia nitens]